MIVGKRIYGQEIIEIEKFETVCPDCFWTRRDNQKEEEQHEI